LRRDDARRRNPHVVHPFSAPKESMMTDNKKKGDFNKGGKDDVGGDKKQRADRNEDSRTGGQNSGSGGRD
jgi:hypothetical protein